MIVDLYRALNFIEFVALKSFRNKQLPPSAFSDEEQNIYDFLTSWAEEKLNFRSSKSTSTEKKEIENAIDATCDFIDELCRKLTELKSEISDKDG